MFRVLTLSLGLIAGLSGIGVIVFRNRVLAVIRKRYEAVSERYRASGNEGIAPESVPGMPTVVLLGLGMCLFGIFAVVVAFAATQ